MPNAAKSVVRAVTLLAGLPLVVTALAACDSEGPSHAPTGDFRQVTVVGSGQVQGAPDTLTADVAVEFTEPDVTSAMNRTSERQQAVIDAVIRAGVERKDISTTHVSLQPQYGGEPRAIIGYRATNSLDVKIRDLRSASEVLQVIVSTGGDATRIDSVNYSIEDDSQLVRDARSRAFEDAKDRAEQYAELSGLSLGKVISISESDGSSPPLRPMPAAPRGAMMESVPLEPGEQTVSFSVTVNWELN